VCALTSYGQSATMTQSAITTDVHQTLDVHLHSFPKVTLYFALRFKDAANPA
jgi:hypothetical protein